MSDFSDVKQAESRVFFSTQAASKFHYGDEPFSERVRRVVDILVAVTGIVLTAPVMMVYAVALRLVSPGPVFVGIDRVGRHGNTFKLFKLRTMCCDAEARLKSLLAVNEDLRREWESGFKLKRDPRLVPYIGWIARRFSIDELPQLINVLRGEMTLVGPRPFPAYHLEAFTPDFRQRRSSVVPGLTGLWQVERRGNSLNEQIMLDEKYLANRNLWYDFTIFVRTFKAVIVGHGAN